MGLRIGALVVDSRDPGRLARFWAAALDWVIARDEDPEWVVEPPEGSRDDCAWVVMADPEGNEFCVQNAHSPQVRAQWLQRYEAYQPAGS